MHVISFYYETLDYCKAIDIIHAVCLIKKKLTHFSWNCYSFHCSDVAVVLKYSSRSSSSNQRWSLKIRRLCPPIGSRCYFGFFSKWLPPPFWILHSALWIPSNTVMANIFPVPNSMHCWPKCGRKSILRKRLQQMWISRNSDICLAYSCVLTKYGVHWTTIILAEIYTF